MKYMFSLLLMLLSLTAFTTAPAFTSDQTQQIQHIIHDYVIAHPEILVKASENLQQQTQERAAAKADKAIRANQQALFFDPDTPSLGAKNPELILVEFFDYQCGHCKRLNTVTTQALKDHPTLKIVFKDLPIYGDTSYFAAAAGIAAFKADRFEALHAALLGAEGKLSREKTLAIAEQAGINPDTLNSVANNPETKALIERNYRSADALGIVGTPSLVLARVHGHTLDSKKVYFIPGAIDKATLNKLIAQASAA